MDLFLQENDIGYKIIGINNTYKFELPGAVFYYKISGVKNYHHLIMYVSTETFEKKYSLLENKIKLLGVIDTMNTYKYEEYYKNLDSVINIIKYFI